MSLDPVIQAYLLGNTVRVAHLVEFCFKTQTRRLWNGSYELVTSDDHHWFGLRKLGAIEGIDEPGALEASEMKFTVSGVDDRFLTLFTMASDESRDEYVERHARIFYAFFDEDWQNLGDPVARAFGIMGTIGLSANPVEDGGKSFTRRTISITAQNFLAARRSPPFSNYSTIDQQHRSPGDRGLEHISELIDTNIALPWAA